MAVSPPPLIGVVEDNDEDFWVLDRLLTGRFRVMRWRTAEEALSAFRRGHVLQSISILFVDFHLPGIDGIEFVRRMRGLAGGMTIAVVMLSGSPHEPLVERAREAGVSQYEQKPQTLSEMHAVVDRSLTLLPRA